VISVGNTSLLNVSNSSVPKIKHITIIWNYSKTILHLKSHQHFAHLPVTTSQNISNICVVLHLTFTSLDHIFKLKYEDKSIHGMYPCKKHENSYIWYMKNDAWIMRITLTNAQCVIYLNDALKNQALQGRVFLSHSGSNPQVFKTWSNYSTCFWWNS
jgi:hypothetical protein